MGVISDLGLSGLGQIFMTARDLARATAFYRDTLGLPLLFEAGGMAFFDLWGVRLMLGVPESREVDHPGSILYFRVDDIERAYEGLRTRDVELVREPGMTADIGSYELWLAFFNDSEGNLLALMSDVPKS